MVIAPFVYLHMIITVCNVSYIGAYEFEGQRIYVRHMGTSFCDYVGQGRVIDVTHIYITFPVKLQLILY